MSGLAERIRAALDGTALAAAGDAAVSAWCERRADDARATALGDAAVRGLARVLASQPDVAGFLRHRAGFLGELAGLAKHGLAGRAGTFGAEAAHLATLPLEDALDGLRLRRRQGMALAACADLGGLASFEEVSDFLSELAESTIGAALALARRELPRRQDDPDDDDFAVIGMGKLAGRELTYHSDLDLIFLFRGGPDRIARASRIGTRLISYLTMMTGAGVAYDVDTRLRPSGRQGMLVTSFDAFERYQLEEAATWEHLAQLRGRAVAGAPEAAAVVERVHAHILSRRRRPWDELAALREQVRAERAADGAHIALKTGAGGLMDVDFLAGGGLLERGATRFPAIPSVPAMLRACTSGPAVEALLADYHLLRVVEARTRWTIGRSVESLDGGSAQLPVIAELVEPGLPPGALLERIAAGCARIRSAWSAVTAAGSLAALDSWP